MGTYVGTVKYRVCSVDEACCGMRMKTGGEGELVCVGGRVGRVDGRWGFFSFSWYVCRCGIDGGETLSDGSSGTL